MAIIRCDKQLDTSTGKYKPANWRIEGDGMIEVSYQFMNEADPEYVRQDGIFLIIGPYRLRIEAQSRSIDGHYLCSLVSERQERDTR